MYSLLLWPSRPTHVLRSRCVGACVCGGVAAWGVDMRLGRPIVPAAPPRSRAFAGTPWARGAAWRVARGPLCEGGPLARGGAAPRLCLDARLRPPRPPDRARCRNTPGRVPRGACAFVGARGALTAPDRLSTRMRCGIYAGVPFGAAVRTWLWTTPAFGVMANLCP